MRHETVSREVFRVMAARVSQPAVRHFGWCGSGKESIVSSKAYEYETCIRSADQKGGAYVAFPYDIRKEFGKGRVKVHATFDGEPYDGSIVNMGVKNEDGSICYIIGVKKEIRARIGKQPGDRVRVTVRERE